MTLASTVLAAGTDRGHEVLAHLGAHDRPADGGELYLGRARPVSAGPDGTLTVARQRWAGLLIEDAVLDGSPALLTVATDAVPPVPGTSAGRA